MIRKIINTLLFTLFYFSGFSVLLPSDSSGIKENIFPYAIKRNLDYSTAGFCMATNAVARFVLEPQKPTLSVADISNLKTSDIYFGIDVSATNQKSIAALDWSNAIGIGLPLVPAIAIPMLAKRRNMWTLYTMYVEAFAVNLGINEIVKDAVNRPRPLLYNPNYSLAFKMENGNDNLKSFYSEHTSNAFMAAVFLSKVYADLGGKHKKLITALTLTTAASVGYLRYASGKHFPTDLITGAIIGSGIGYLIPVLHKQSEKNKNISMLPVFYNSMATGIYFCYRF